MRQGEAGGEVAGALVAHGVIMPSRADMLMAEQGRQVLDGELLRRELGERVAQLIRRDLAVTAEDRTEAGLGVRAGQATEEYGPAVRAGDLVKDRQRGRREVERPRLAGAAAGFVGGQHGRPRAAIDLGPVKPPRFGRAATGRGDKTEDAARAVGQGPEDGAQAVGVDVAGAADRAGHLVAPGPELGNARGLGDPAARLVGRPAEQAGGRANAVDYGFSSVSSSKGLGVIDQQRVRQVGEQSSTGVAGERVESPTQVGAWVVFAERGDQAVDRGGCGLAGRLVRSGEEVEEAGQGCSILGEAGADRVRFSGEFSVSCMFRRSAKVAERAVDPAEPVAAGVNVWLGSTAHRLAPPSLESSGKAENSQLIGQNRAWCVNSSLRRKSLCCQGLKPIGVTGFEPATSASRTQRAIVRNCCTGPDLGHLHSQLLLAGMCPYIGPFGRISCDVIPGSFLKLDHPHASKTAGIFIEIWGGGGLVGWSPRGRWRGCGGTRGMDVTRGVHGMRHGPGMEFTRVSDGERR